MERRKFTRYQVLVPVIFGWTDHMGVSRQERGFVRDISTGGLFVLCDVHLHLEAALTLEVLLPSLDAAASGLRLRGEGLVVRIEEHTGFAVAGMVGRDLLEPDQ